MVSLGIDTSNYTTSVALSHGDKGLLFEKRIPIRVRKGAVGIRQSDAFFQHMQHLDGLLRDIGPWLEAIGVIVVSVSPRNVPGSYMPVFRAGEIFAGTLAAALKVPVIGLSHQEGHILSGWPEEFKGIRGFNVLQISGGTTELLYVNSRPRRWEIEILYRTLDISFGQLIDRIGVMMGCDFPAGKALDARAGTYEKTRLRIALKEDGFNLSGIENHLQKRIDRGEDLTAVSGVLFSYLLEVITAIDKNYRREGPLLVIGGVGESQFIRRALEPRGVYFAPEGLSSDNSVGLSRYPFIMEVASEL
ncbi:MAG: hypothetical protein AVO33_10845 [delta proteobacterium ML8_F1]|nr:MAG: hypothetical protein AVO33_10845 [delta proteobacterium ML8_F1]